MSSNDKGAPTREQCIEFLQLVAAACPGEDRYPAIIALLRSTPVPQALTEGESPELFEWTNRGMLCVSQDGIPNPWLPDEQLVRASEYTKLDCKRASLSARVEALEGALDQYRLTRNAIVAGLPHSWTDLDKTVNALLRNEP